MTQISDERVRELIAWLEQPVIQRERWERDVLAALNELQELRAHRCGLPDSIIQALNSGDGTYRP